MFAKLDGKHVINLSELKDYSFVDSARILLPGR